MSLWWLLIPAICGPGLAGSIIVGVYCLLHADAPPVGDGE